MLYSEKNLDFDHACKLILSLLKTVYNGLVNKEARLKDKDKENNIPAKKRKTNNDSGSQNIFLIIIKMLLKKEKKLFQTT